MYMHVHSCRLVPCPPMVNIYGAMSIRSELIALPRVPQGRHLYKSRTARNHRGFVRANDFCIFFFVSSTQGACLLPTPFGIRCVHQPRSLKRSVHSGLSFLGGCPSCCCGCPWPACSLQFERERQFLPLVTRAR
ncbi:unnamed protein product [Ectocarpus sp. 6 AP-2014]